MKKVSIVSLCSLLFLSVCSTVAYLLKNIGKDKTIPLLLIGIGALVLSGVLAFFAKRSIMLNVACSLINATALGALIRVWYMLRGFNNSLPLMLAVSLAATAYLWLFWLLAKIPVFNRHTKLFMILFVLLSLAAYITVVFTTKTTFVSTFGYYMIIVLAFIFAMCKSTDEPSELVRAVTLSTYSVFAVAFIVGLAILLDGDIDLDLDFSLDDEGSEIAVDMASDAAESAVEAKRKKRK